MIFYNDRIKIQLSNSCKNIKLTSDEQHVIYGISSIIEIGNCLFVDVKREGRFNINPDFVKRAFGDYTGYEASNNHFHVGDLFAEIDSTQSTIELGLKIIEVWEEVIKDKFPNNEIVFTLTSNDDGISVRFNKYRSDEGYWIEPDKINDYNEGIMVKKIKL